MPDSNKSPDAALNSEADYDSTEFLARRRAAVARVEGTAWKGVDETDPKGPSGHARGVQVSTSLTSYYRRTHREGALDITPDDVIHVLKDAGLTKWVLMGLHGYVGYLPQPRATQDVDILIPASSKKKAIKAVSSAWPTLVIEQLETVVRFKDPADLDPDGRPKPVVDLMLPWSPLNEAILASEEHVVVDDKTQHIIPKVEAALASKYSALISDFRNWDKKQQDAVDFRRIARANYNVVDLNYLRRLGEMVWSDGGGVDLERFFDIAQEDKPFPV